jgi:septation ring formation regulator EzrA
MRKYKIISFLLIVIFCMNIALPGITAFAVESSSTEGSNIIYISSAEDLISLAKKCSLDIWSREKTVILMNNIDLSGIEFTSIPTFGGIFDGQGYTISGLSLTGYGSPQGLFCYIQEGALIKKLTVKGIVTPVGTKSIVGGVAGNNSGTIQNCIFNGVIRGDEYIGGIAGINQAKGLISNCSVQGIAYGEHNVGGIAGENFGTILLSTNKASINTTVEESTFNLEDISNINIEKLSSFSTADIVNISDIGGIAGFSSGIIQSCSNSGTVGYRSVGYNIGGIVGRQSGYVNGCTNNGIIYGRKDVGGIAGQIEPYAFWELSENSLGKLRKELNTLQSLINTAINNTDQYSSAISTQLTTVGRHIEDVKTAGDVLVDQTISLLNDNIDNINNVSARITQVLVAMEPIMGSFSIALSDMKMAIGKLKTTMEQMKIMAKGIEFGIYKLNPALDKIDAALDATKGAFDNISNSLTSLKAGLGDPEAMKDALSSMQRGITSLIAGMVKVADGARDLQDAVNKLQDSEVWRENAPIIKNGINELSIGINKMNDALQAISDALIRLEGDFDEEKLSAALTSLESALANFAVGTEKLSSGISKISSGLEKIINAYKDNEAIQLEWYEEISEGVQDIADSMEDMQKAIGDLQDMLNYLQEANIDPEQTRKDLEAIMQGFADLAIATGDVIDVMIKINTATVRLLQSEEIKAFGVELVQSLQEIHDGVTQAIYAMERVNLAMKKLSDQIDFDKLNESIDYLKASIEDMSNVIAIIQDIKPYVEAASPYFETASDYASQAFASAIEAIALLENSGATMADAAAQIHNLISDLAKHPEITVKKVDSKYLKTKDQFSQALGETLNALSGLNSIISEASPTLLADIKAVSNQMFVVFDLLVDTVENVSEMDTNIRDYTKDVSARDTDSDTFGKVADSINYGQVEGDINVGGITGSMAIEFEYDLEDEYNLIQKMSPNSKYLLRAIISGCENYGNIKSKKNCAGGIVGLMDFGYVKESIDNSSITSTGGNYIGGIAGKSDGTIRQCYAKSLLSGADFVGGIAGYATNLYDCYSLISVENAREFAGAIAGEGDGLWEGNYFVHDELAAVNRISYAGKAEPITYETLLSVEGLPEIFKTFRLTFVAEDEEIAIISFNYGDTIPENQIPHVPKKEGYWGKWETDDYKDLKFDATIEAVYEQYITTLASKHTRDNGLSVILVNGLFDKDASLTVTEIEKKPEGERISRGEKVSEDEQNLIDRRISKGERDSTEICLFKEKQVLEEWTVSVTDDGLTTRTVHYLAPAQKTSGISIYLLQDGIWRKTKYTTKGKYLIFKMEGTDAIFVVISSEKNPVRVILIITVISAVIATFLWLLRKWGKGSFLYDFKSNRWSHHKNYKS